MKLERIEGSGGRVYVDAEFVVPVRALGLHEAGGMERALAGARFSGSERQSGRGINRVLPLPGRSECLHLRPLHHGGWLERWLGRRWLSLKRPLSEFGVTRELRQRGAPVAVPVLVHAARRGLFWQSAVGTLHQSQAVDGRRFLSQGPEPALLQRAAQATGRALRQLHDLGAHHADLHLGNLLLTAVGEEVLVQVIDFDRGRLAEPPSASRRSRELGRLYRSVVKWGFADLVDESVCSAFYLAYVGEDPSLREALLGWLPRERRRLRMHALGYRALS